jgi:hypothetical protein
LENKKEKIKNTHLAIFGHGKISMSAGSLRIRGIVAYPDISLCSEVGTDQLYWQLVARHQSISVIIGCYGLAAGVQLTPLKNPQHPPFFLEKR